MLTVLQELYVLFFLLDEFNHIHVECNYVFTEVSPPPPEILQVPLLKEMIQSV